MAACTLITYDFDDLALLMDGKYGGLFANGSATIASYSADEWYVRDLQIDGIEVDREANPWLWARVATALEEQQADSIAEAIRMEDEGIAERLRAFSRSAA